MNPDNREEEAIPQIVPHSRESEEALLGSVIINPGCWDDVSHVPKEDFYIHRHRWIWEAMAAIITREEPLDFLTITHELENRNRLAEVGGAAYLTALIGAVPSSLNANTYAKIVQDTAIRRKILEYANKAAKIAYDPERGVECLLEEAESIKSLLNSRRNGQIYSWLHLQEEIGPVEWDWNQWLPRGFLTLVAGESGMGKSNLALWVAGTYLTGRPWPDGTPLNLLPGSIIWCEAEAAQAINLDRARRWGFPLEKILTPLSPTHDFRLNAPLDRAALLHKIAQVTDLRLIVVDSLRGAMGGDENSSEIITWVKWLAEIARDYNIPVMLLHHLRKRGISDGNAISLDRLRGSSAIAQPARVIWALDDPDPDSGWKRLSVIKNNMAKFSSPLGIQLSDTIQFGNAPETPRVETVRDKASDLLLSLLKPGPMRATQIEDEFNQAGISWVSAKRAKSNMNIVSLKLHDGWYWSLSVKQ